MFTQIWPTSICAVMNEESTGSCKLPQKASGWTVHGMWSVEAFWKTTAQHLAKSCLGHRGTPMKGRSIATRKEVISTQILFRHANENVTIQKKYNLQSIKDQLDDHWPNLEPKASEDSLW